ncbi:MAG TPA: SpoIIE family protein phosphatase [Planctomycetota bacterium]|nr:SpoIIE family protein phosphatase [Planctomycetota bacterium]
MPSDGPGPKSTQRTKSASSGQIPHVGGKPGSTAKIPAPPSTARKTTQRSKPEVVASSDDQDLSEVRMRVATPPSATLGLSLKWKIVIAMAAITVATAMLIFVSINSKAVNQLSDEIDAKGIRLVKTLASIDAPLWKAAMGSQKDDRKRKLDFLSTKFNPEMTAASRENLFKQYPEVKAMYDQLIDPFGPLHTLKSDQRDIGPNSDILQITVVDPTGGAGSVQAVEGTGEKGISISTRHKDATGVEIGDGRDKGSDQEVRLYRMEKNGLDFNVILSLARINEARGALKSSILLPVLVSMLAGIGIAVWIGTLITNPIKHLMADMNQVSNGDLDHKTVAHSKDEVGLLAQTFGRMTVALRAAHDQEIESKALEHDLAIASEIQSNLVPKRMLKVPGYDISAYYRPSKEVGGDYYDFIEIDAEHEGFIVADVSGKGVPGSLVMTMARAFIRMEAERSRNTSPADTLMKANRMLAQDIKKGMFVTALYCILNKRTNELRVASAGHNPLVVWRAATNQVQLVNPNGIALGFDKGPVFERTVKDEVIVLGHGDRIVAFTDGTVEAMNAKNQEFGDERFYTLIRDLAPRDSNQMLNLLVKELDEHKGHAPQSDDITIVTLRFLQG